MSAAPQKKKELARGERVVPGAWRLRLPLPWPGVPHCNAWAVRRGDGIVLFDTGYAGPDGTRPLEYALAQIGFELTDVKLVACTHVHSDHYGLAGPIADASGCEVWLHPNWEDAREYAEDPDGVLERRLEVARQSGVPQAALERYREERQGEPSGIARAVPPDRELVDGVEVETDLGTFVVHETPGHAPSHVVFHQPESGLLISGDHVLGRIVLYFDYGLTPDPVAEYKRSLDVVERLETGLCLSGHGRPFRGVPEKVQATREVLERQLAHVRDAAGEEPCSAFDLLSDILGAENLGPETAPWALQITLAYLDHLTNLGQLEETQQDGTRRWRRA